MKKIYITLIILFGVFLFCGCSTYENEISNSMSEIRMNFFDGETEKYTICITSGLREEPYKIDGIPNELVEFGIIELELFDKLVTANELNYCLNINGAGHNGKLEKNPFKDNYMVDIRTRINDEDKLEFKLENEENFTIINCKSVNFDINYIKAIEIATNNMKQELSQYFKKNKFNGECYLKIIDREQDNKEVYFWYFNVKTTDNKSHSCIIDVKTGNVVVKVT